MITSANQGSVILEGSHLQPANAAQFVEPGQTLKQVDAGESGDIGRLVVSRVESGKRYGEHEERDSKPGLEHARLNAKINHPQQYYVLITYGVHTTNTKHPCVAMNTEYG